MRVKICELQAKNSTYYNEVVEQKAITKLQEEQLTLLKEEVRNLKKHSHSSQDLELKVRDLELGLMAQHKQAVEKNQ